MNRQFLVDGCISLITLRYHYYEENYSVTEANYRYNAV